MITSDQLLDSVKRAQSVPASQPLLTDAAILGFCDEVISSRIVPLIESVDSEFFVRVTTTPVIPGQSEYKIPYRAVGRGLRDLKLVDVNSNTRSLPLIALEDTQLYIQTTGLVGFYFKNDRIHLVPDVTDSISAYELHMFWRIQPNKLIPTSNAGVISNIALDSGGFDQITLVTLPSFATSGSKVDLVEGRSGSSIYSFDQTIQNVVGNTLYFTANSIPTFLEVGDYVCPPQYSPVLNSIPDEAIGLIRSHVSVRILTAIGDFEAAKIIKNEDIPAEERDLKSLMQPRIDGESVIVINRRSLLRGNKFSQRRWLGPP